MWDLIPEMHENIEKVPCHYNKCPDCGGIKRTVARRCWNCKVKTMTGEKNSLWKGGLDANRKRYNQSEKGRVSSKRYKGSKKGRIVKSRYETSKNGKIKRRKIRERKKEKKLLFINSFKAQVGCQAQSCKINEPVILDFHHPDGRNGDSRKSITEKSWKDIFKMCEETILLCANHHRWEHAGSDLKLNLTKS